MKSMTDMNSHVFMSMLFCKDKETFKTNRINIKFGYYIILPIPHQNILNTDFCLCINNSELSCTQKPRVSI